MFAHAALNLIYMTKLTKIFWQCYFIAYFKAHFRFSDELEKVIHNLKEASVSHLRSNSFKRQSEKDKDTFIFHMDELINFLQTINEKSKEGLGHA